MDLLNHLIELHETNTRLLAIDELKGDLPHLLDKEETELNVITEEQNTIETKMTELNSELSNHESNLNNNSDQLNKYNDQLFNVTNNKEYDALLLEIDHLKTEIFNLKEKISIINQEKETLELSIQSNKEKIDSLSDSITNNKKQLSDQMLETDKEEQVLLKHRESATKKIDTQYLTQYNKMLNKYGQGMAHISRNSCNNCYTQLPSQLIVEVEYDKKIITCPSCSVFLYHKNDKD
ncbi:MAG: hypothetical protein CMD65_01505 [Gammaproteobacteria bacterium]|nr:hypothetical protein [Gammaproteobacteria bacterium]